MGPELELNVRPDGVTALCVKENGGHSVYSKDEFLKCESNCEEHALEMENSGSKPLVAEGNKDVEVNVTELTTSDGNGLIEPEVQDATDSSSSSSFGDTVSGSDDAANISDTEVGSDLHSYRSSTLEINGFADTLRMRKKKVTSHWRTFIQPIVWRSKWVELQVKKLRSQALKCDRELANYNQRKSYVVENFPVEGFGMKSLPFPNDGPTDLVFKRKKRRRVEDTTDVKSYMSHHNLFSFYENRIRTDGAYVDDHWGNQDKINGNDECKVNDERLLLESMDNNNSLEELLRKIGLLETQVNQLKSRFNNVINENAGKISSADNWGMLVPPNLTSSAQCPASPPNNGNRMLLGSSDVASQVMSQYNMGNLVMPEGAISSNGELSCIPDVIEGTDQSHLEDASVKTEDDLLIYNMRLKQERNNFDEVSVQHMEKPQIGEQEQESTFTRVLAEPDLHKGNEPAPKVRSIAKLTTPKNRRKRGRRKAGSGRWSRKSSG